MKTFKALRKPSTDEYWTWNNVHEKWMPSGTPDLLSADVAIGQLKAIDALPPDAGDDIELAEVFIMDSAEKGRIKKDFIEEHPLQLLFFGKEIEQVMEILKEANEHYALEHKRNDAEEADRGQIDIVCPTTSFANAYYHIGTEIGKKILSKRKD